MHGGDMDEWQQLAWGNDDAYLHYGADRPTGAFAVECLAGLTENAVLSARLRAAVAAYQEQNPLHRELNYISRHIEEYCFLSCVQTVGQETLGRLLGSRLHFTAYGLLGYLMLLSPNLGAALHTALRFPLQLGSYFTVFLDSNGRHARLRFERYQGRAELYGFHLTLCRAAYRQIIIPLIQADGTAFAEQDASTHGTDALLFPAEWLHRPLPYAQAGSFVQTLRQCQQQEMQIARLLTAPLVQEVRRLIASDFRRYHAMAEVAGHLHVSERTLHRRLRKYGTSFQSLLDDTRLYAALPCLHARSVPLWQLAEHLGFSDTAAFKAAFKRWTGLSLTAFLAR